MKEMVMGQFYRIALTGVHDDETTTTECLVIATSEDDARLRIPYAYDLSDFSRYRVDWVLKEPSRAFVIRSTTNRAPKEQPAAVIKRIDGSQDIWQNVRTLDRKKWQVYARTVVFAKDEKQAQKKLAERLEGNNESVQWSAEEISAGSAFAQAKDVSMFRRAHFVRG